jgi:hypothetical protein
MKRFVKVFLGLAGFGLLALSLTPLTVHHADASGGAPVIVQKHPQRKRRKYAERNPGEHLACDQ